MEEFKIDYVEKFEEDQIIDLESPILKNQIENVEKNSEVEKQTEIDTKNLHNYYTFVGSNPENETSEPTENIKDKTHTPEISKVKKRISIHPNESKSERVIVLDKDDLLSSFSKSKKKEKRHECRICKKKFYSQSHVRQHEYIHSGVKPFECTYCQKRFSQGYNLKKHERIHTGEVPYECL